MRRTLTVFLVVLAGCIDPLPVDLASVERALVVDGMITNEPGPYTVKLFWSGSPETQSAPPELISAATVEISDDLNRTTLLTEIAPGMYSSREGELQGEVGRIYTLRIQLSDGDAYESAPEMLYSSGTLDRVYFAYDEDAINQTDRSLPQDAITFMVDATRDIKSTPFLRWRSSGIYEIVTYPELRTTMRDGIRVPDPLPCSGYINDQDKLVQIDTCSCCNCWVYEYPHEAVVSPNTLENVSEYRSISIARQPVDKWRFFRKYYLQVEQLSVSENVYNFWSLVMAQQQGTGSLFQPNAVRVRGNVRCVTDAGKEAFGIFSASAITEKSIFITRDQLPKVLAPPDKVAFDCRYVIDNADNDRPPFW